MSADNGLLLAKTQIKGSPEYKYYAWEYNASTGFNYWYKEFDTLEEAIKYLQDFMENNDVEYGLQLRI